jgi:transcriptional regulator with XRE-family HTH domain
MNKERFIKDLLDALSRLKVNQTELAKYSGCSQSSINYYISGKHTPSADIFLKICDRLSMNPVTYLGQESSWKSVFEHYTNSGNGENMFEFLSKNYYAPRGK